MRESSEVNVNPNRAFVRLREALAAKPELLRPWRGPAFRVTTLDYPTPQSILLGKGSYLHGGRWNAIGSFRAVYGSTADTVAVAESRATADYVGIPLPLRTPRLLVAITFSLQAVVDLTSDEVLQELRLSKEELCTEDWRKIQEQGFESFTQAIGRAVFMSGAEGLLSPSARVTAGVNIVFFPENQRSHSEAIVHGSEKLEGVRLEE